MLQPSMWTTRRYTPFCPMCQNFPVVTASKISQQPCKFLPRVKELGLSGKEISNLSFWRRNLRNFLKEQMLKGYRDFTSYETQTGSWLKQELMSWTVWHVHLIGSDERPAVRFNLFEDKLIYCLQVICLAQGMHLSNAVFQTLSQKHSILVEYIHYSEK